MLPAAYRFPLRSHSDFFLNSHRLKTDYLIGYIRQNGLNHIRYSVIVPKKSTSLAVHRSRLKRILIDRIGLTLPPTIAVDLVLRVNKQPSTYPDYELIVTDLQNLVHQIYSKVSTSSRNSR